MDAIYLGMVFISTAWIYSIHRIVGIDKLKTEVDPGRFKVIRQYKSHIRFYIFLSSICLIWVFTQLTLETSYYLLPVGFISALYVIPLMKGGKRIRDFNYIKIFLIGFVWAYVACLPLLGEGIGTFKLSLLFLEKMIFIIAITIPFDIRDLEIDTAGGLATVAKLMGTKNAYFLSYILLAIGFLLFILCHGLHGITVALAIAIYLTTLGLIALSKGKSSDWYFSGLIDGSLIIRGLLALLFCTQI